MDNDGYPYKGTKSSTTKRRYTVPPIISNNLPQGWIPHSAILEGMFMIQIAPLPSMTCMEQYVKLLLSRLVKPHFSAGVIEVHVVFDAPGSQRESPKEIEQHRRDKCAKEKVGPHNCVQFSSDLLIPDKWRNVLSCRICKKSLTRYIAEDMLRLLPHSLQSHQQFITNAGSSCSRGKQRCLINDLITNAGEADLKVWLHCKNSCGVNKLIFSPDTDIYHIGLPLLTIFPEC